MYAVNNLLFLTATNVYVEKLNGHIGICQNKLGCTQSIQLGTEAIGHL